MTHSQESGSGISTESEERKLSALDISAVITLPDGDGPFKLVDYTSQFGDGDGDGVWALADPASGEFEGLVCDGGGIASPPVVVTFHGYSVSDGGQSDTSPAVSWGSDSETIEVGRDVLRTFLQWTYWDSAIDTAPEKVQRAEDQLWEAINGDVTDGGE